MSIKSFVYSILARLTGKNFMFTPKETILAQTQEKRLLPIGAQEFEEFADRIISGALLTADKDSQKYAIAGMLIHLGPTEAAKDDAYFISSLRKVAVNQVAHAKMQEIQALVKARLSKEEQEKALKAQENQLAIIAEQDKQLEETKNRLSLVTKQSEVTPTIGVTDEVLRK